MITMSTKNEHINTIIKKDFRKLSDNNYIFEFENLSISAILSRKTLFTMNFNNKIEMKISTIQRNQIYQKKLSIRSLSKILNLLYKQIEDKELELILKNFKFYLYTKNNILLKFRINEVIFL